jgi:hypothetical protein
MRHHHRIVLALALSALASAIPAACGSPTQVRRDVPLGEAFWLDAGGLAVLREGSMVLRFREIASDSRCPTEALVRCVSAGSARVEVSLASEVGDETVFDLDTDGRLGRSERTIGALRVHLIEVRPSVRAEAPIDAREYQARFMVTRPVAYLSGRP